MGRTGCWLGSLLQHNLVSDVPHSSIRGTGLQAYAGVIQPSSTPQTSPLQSITNPRGCSRAFQPAFSTPARTSASSLHPSSAFSLRSVQSTLPSTLSNVTSCSQSSTADQGSPASSKTGGHPHWCNICEHPKEIEKCDGYKRHMREHETIYLCMPNGPVNSPETGPECYFCGAWNPDQAHFATHGVSKCYGGYAKRQSYTRRVNLSNHIKDAHNTSENRASALAKEWGDCHKNKRIYFSCGFCICHFTTLKDKSSHIDVEHWRQHQELKEWDNNKVILGLLSQPGVEEEWHQLLRSAGIDPELEPGPQWSPSVVEHVQLQLEIREDSPAALADLAFTKSSYYLVYQANVSTGTLQPCNQGKDVVGHLATEQNTIGMMQLPNDEFVQISGDSPMIDNRLHASHGHQANSYHGNAPGFAQIMPGTEHGRLQSNTGSYEEIATNSQQNMGLHDHSNPFYLDPSWGATGSIFDSETLSSSPWSTYTASQRPGSAQDPVLSEESNSIRASFDPIPNGIHMDIASAGSADQPEIYIRDQASTPMGNLSSSVDETTPLSSKHAPARRKSSRPNVIGGSKRKLSGSQTRESRYDRETNPIVVETKRGSRDHYHDDHLRSKKRIEGYNGHD